MAKNLIYSLKLSEQTKARDYIKRMIGYSNEQYSGVAQARATLFLVKMQLEIYCINDKIKYKNLKPKQFFFE